MTSHAARRAFTLVEVLVALVLLAVGFVAAARCLEQAVRAARRSALAAALTDLARTRADERRHDACAASAAAGAVDSAGVHVAWQSIRRGPAAHVAVAAVRTPAAAPSDSAAASVTVWCGS